MGDNMIIRFDDICGNTCVSHLESLINFCQKSIKAVVLCVISPLYFSNARDGRVYPKEFNAISDYKEFFKPDSLYMFYTKNVDEKTLLKANHGLFHIDHRLLSKDHQEVSILTGCSLTKTKIFVPPFNKWNHDTESICEDNDIELVKFEDGWRSIEHCAFNPDFDKWYLHDRNVTIERLMLWSRSITTSYLSSTG